MSFIFSRALVEAYLEASCSDSAPFAPSNSNPIPQACCSPDRMTAYSRLSRFGMTYEPLTDDRGAALLTWYLEASRARTFQPQEKAPALTAPAPASGGKCTELSMKYDRNSHSWKTHLCLWDEDLPESSVILPKSGTMRNGLCWERTMWEPRTSESASGYLHMIPTPTACNAPNKGSHSRGPKSLMDVATTGWMPVMMWPTLRAGKSSGENPESWLARYVAGKVSTPPLGLDVKFATPQARDFRTGEARRWEDPARSRNLNDQIAKFPTPTSRDWKDSGSSQGNRKSPNLGTIASRFPTPRTKVMCGGTGSYRKMKDLEAKGIISSEERRQMTAGSGGQLNPTWVEWLMGWPLEWTALKPLATDKYRLWQQLHSGFCLADSKKERRGNESHS